MSDNIRRVTTFKTKANDQTVAMLRDFLAMAEAGEIESVAIIGMEPGGACRTQCSATNDFQRMIGAIEILKFRMLDESRRAG